MAATIVMTTDETTEAREHTAQRLERLARWIRAHDTATLEQLDEAYGEIVKCAGRVRTMLGEAQATTTVKVLP